MPNPVTTADLEARFRPFTGTAEEDTAQALLDDAWEVLLMTVPDLDARIDAGTVSTGAAVFVVTSMVLRVLRNPNGVRQWSVDDYSETRDSSLSAGALYASEGEIALLTGRASTARRRAFSITPGQPATAAPASESEYIDYLRSGSPYGTYPPPVGSWPS